MGVRACGLGRGRGGGVGWGPYRCYPGVPAVCVPHPSHTTYLLEGVRPPPRLTSVVNTLIDGWMDGLSSSVWLSFQRRLVLLEPHQGSRITVVTIRLVDPSVHSIPTHPPHPTSPLPTPPHLKGDRICNLVTINHPPPTAPSLAHLTQALIVVSRGKLSIRIIP